ncbi:hypothetical protein PAXRUDRAFT_415503 [Paxillus rubicundulus Ve08.2h10]|uniref:Uncharacterized protein n=1 Tax=Paxillus rubicundulus Ve08.2h10 TaxID=930991 RepID=A0A0D0DXW3_9AGAM|nr:hypothetical protein PAXRUDRAFT_415503 [Paxillus rubicundulus Ve08.2h10]
MSVPLRTAIPSVNLSMLFTYRHVQSASSLSSPRQSGVCMPSSFRNSALVLIGTETFFGLNIFFIQEVGGEQSSPRRFPRKDKHLLWRPPIKSIRSIATQPFLLCPTNVSVVVQLTDPSPTHGCFQHAALSL